MSLGFSVGTMYNRGSDARRSTAASSDVIDQSKLVDDNDSDDEASSPEVELLFLPSVALILIGFLCVAFNAVAIAFSDPFSIFCHGLFCGIFVSVYA